MRAATWRVAAAAAMVGALSLACGGDDDATVAADEPVVITMVDFAFEGVPDSIPAGTAITVVNEAPTELHEVVAFRLPDDEERSVDELAHLAPGELVAVLGEPAAVILAVPDGDPIVAVGDGTLAEPGRYALMCFIPTGVDPDVYLAAAAETEEGPPQVDGGPPHFVHGMVAEITVT